MVVKGYPQLAPEMTVIDKLEFLAMERMKGMGNPEKSTRTLGIGCN
jgi:hypothetical protein